MSCVQMSLNRNTTHPGAFTTHSSQPYMQPDYPQSPVEFIAMPPQPQVQYVVAPQAYGQFAQLANNQVNCSFQPSCPQINPALFELYQQNRYMLHAIQPAAIQPAFVTEQHPTGLPKMLPSFPAENSLPMVFPCPASPSPPTPLMMGPYHSQTLPEIQLTNSSLVEYQQDCPLDPQEAVWQAQCEAERDQCYNDLLAAFNTIEAVKRSVKKNEILRWNDKEKKAVDNLIEAMKTDYAFWAESSTSYPKNMELLKIYTEIVGEMAKLIEFETKRLKRKVRKLRVLVNQFQRATMPYLKQNDFDVQAAVEFDNFEKTRTLKALVRLFKCMQLFPQLTQSNPEKKDSGLRGDTVVRNRCKRLTSFLSEAHKFDEHLLKLINANEVEIDGMYVCRDHKSEKKGKKKKARVMAGLLFYFVCPSAKAAENLLRKFVQFSEAEGETQEMKNTYQQMFRKDDSRKGDIEADLRKRRRLCSGKPWTEEDFRNQKDMYHFALALSTDMMELFLQNVEMSAVKDNLITIKGSLAKALRIPVKDVDIKNFVSKPDGTVIQFVKPANMNETNINDNLVKVLQRIVYLPGFGNMRIPIGTKAETEKPQTFPAVSTSRPSSRKGSFEFGNGSVGY